MGRDVCFCLVRGFVPCLLESGIRRAIETEKVYRPGAKFRLLNMASEWLSNRMSKTPAMTAWGVGTRSVRVSVHTVLQDLTV